MGFLAPAALALAVLLPVIVAMYLLRLRRTERLVSSVYLWQRLVRDVEANAPWQRLRRNLLLILQLSILAALILALARPFVWSQGVAGQALVLVIDTSASMAAVDVSPNRLEAAKMQARQMIDGLPEDARITLLAAGEAPEVRAASTRDRRQVYRALQDLQASTGGSDLAAALELASAIASGGQAGDGRGTGAPETDIVVLSDGRVELPPRVALGGRVRYEPVGSSGENQAITLLSLQAMPGGDLAAFAQVANYGRAAARRRLVLYADGQAVAAYDIEIPAGGQQAVVAEGLPAAASVVEARLDGDGQTGEEDILSLDDRAWAVNRQAEPAPVTLVTPGNLFLETALALLPGLEVTVVSPGDWERGQSLGGADGAEARRASLTILDSYVPVTATLPAGNLLFVAPPHSTGYFSVTGTVEQPLPRVGEAAHPLLAHLDTAFTPSLGGGIGVSEARRMPLPAWARLVVAGDLPGETVPLLFAGETDGRRVAVLAFDLHRSDLPLHVAFPMLLANLTGWLVPGAGGDLPTQVVPGAAAALSLPPQGGPAVLTRPDGSSVRLVPEGGRVLLEDTAELGLYQVAWAGSGLEEDLGQAQVSFAVNLFSPLESDLRPAEALPIAGIEPAGGGQAAGQGGQARREWWRPLAWLALLLLVAEWLVYHRSAVAAVRDRLRGEKGKKGRSPTRPASRLPPAGLGLFLPFSFLYTRALLLLLLVPLAAIVALLGRRRAQRDRRFWAGLGLRCLLLTLLILALAGSQLRHRADVLTAVFVLDASDSIPAEDQARGEEMVRQAMAGMPAGDRAAVVVFGEDALVERLASGERSLPDLASVPVTTHTDVAGALQLAMALFPDEGARRVVLLSDGRENVGRALAQADLAAAHGISLSYLPLGAPGDGVEVRLQGLDAPSDVRQGESFDLVVRVESSAQVGASLRVLEAGRLIHTQDVHLQPGSNRFLVPANAGAADLASSPAAGFRRFRAQVVPDADGWLQNNEASAFTVVHGPPQVLVVEGRDGEGGDVATALRDAEMGVAVLPPEQMPSTLPGLAGFDAVVLANVPAAALPVGTMEALRVYVRDLGRGLVMIGGEEAFGAGGYQRTAVEEALPVAMDVRTREQVPNLALVLAVDKSGSMGRCHCDNPDLSQSYVRREVGQPKVDIAKEAIMRAAAALGQLDHLGIVAFDEQARWAVELSPLRDPVTLEQAIGQVQAMGQTNLRAGVETAYAALEDANARLKHVILLTDGWVHTGDLTGLADAMRGQGITLSVVAAGEGSAEYLADLARRGGGRYYPAVDIQQVPDFFLKETVQAVGRYIVEEPFFPLPALPSPVLQGLDPALLPLLLGYNGTTPKSTARVALTTPQGDPLLATWQYGLGRAAAWTSDLKGQWAVEWMAWPEMGRFVAQLVGWTLPAPQVEGLAAQVSLGEEGALVHVEATDREGQPRSFLDVSAVVVGPGEVSEEQEASEVALSQVGAGAYEAVLGLSQPGTYLVRLQVRDGERVLGQQTLGLAVPYSPEYRVSGIDLPGLEALSATTGGGRLAEPGHSFLHDLVTSPRIQEVSGTLLLVVALLFPLDVALRRVMLGGRDLRGAAAWLAARLPGPSRQRARSPRALGRLWQARARARVRQARPGGAPASSSPSNAAQGPVAEEPEPGGEPPTGEGGVKPGTASSAEALARLRKAKERAQRRSRPPG